MKAHFYFEKSNKSVLRAPTFSYSFLTNIRQIFTIINDIDTSIYESWGYSEFLKKHNPDLAFLKRCDESRASSDRNILKDYFTANSSFSSRLADELSDLIKKYFFTKQT